MKGADLVMTSIVQYNDWLDEEVKYHVLSPVLCSVMCCVKLCYALLHYAAVW